MSEKFKFSHYSITIYAIFFLILSLIGCFFCYLTDWNHGRSVAFMYLWGIIALYVLTDEKILNQLPPLFKYEFAINSENINITPLEFIDFPLTTLLGRSNDILICKRDIKQINLRYLKKYKAKLNIKTKIKNYNFIFFVSSKADQEILKNLLAALQ